ncbi:hypothetical protein RF11_01258 [Thelohanellus kitauei]|uniref:Uncharacterized protein n=1 Tax=Thelohanellus kitauei TaxID=669202 RepID=A0A0C2JZ79_THEKT|nr:hypothetical protein RF11_01258 [Thelohanellus kitauei]
MLPKLWPVECSNQKSPFWIRCSSISKRSVHSYFTERLLELDSRINAIYAKSIATGTFQLISFNEKIGRSDIPAPGIITICGRRCPFFDILNQCPLMYPGGYDPRSMCAVNRDLMDIPWFWCWLRLSGLS